jgi:hypothetical protein
VELKENVHVIDTDPLKEVEYVSVWLWNSVEVVVDEPVDVEVRVFIGVSLIDSLWLPVAVVSVKVELSDIALLVVLVTVLEEVRVKLIVWVTVKDPVSVRVSITEVEAVADLVDVRVEVTVYVAIPENEEVDDPLLESESEILLSEADRLVVSERVKLVALGLKEGVVDALDSESDCD